MGKSGCRWLLVRADHSSLLLYVWKSFHRAGVSIYLSPLPQPMAGDTFVILPPGRWKTLVFHDRLSVDRCLRKVSWLGTVHSIMLSARVHNQSVEGTHTLFSK